MATVRSILNMHSLGDLQVQSGFQYYQSRILSHRRSWQEDSSPSTYGVASRCLSCDKTRLWSVNVDYDHHRRDRSKKTPLRHRDVDFLRVLKSRPLGKVPPRTLNSDATTSTQTAAEQSAQGKQNAQSENVSEEREQEVAAGSGLSALDTYFSKLNGASDTPGIRSPATVSNSVSAVVLPLATQQNVGAGSGYKSSAATDTGEKAQGLKALDAYFDKLKPKKIEPEPVKEEVKPREDAAAELTDEEKFMKSLIEAKEDYERYRSSMKDQESQGGSPARDLNFQVTGNNDMDFKEWELHEEQTGNSNLINVLVAMNIAVYLFGLASPHEALGITDSSLPIVYGAKVNELIMGGQWWRLITPMFLHASLLHVGLGSWALLSFGPAVESAYGTLGFSMIYFLGGIFGDLTSFFHTTEWTVGGTGPIYALVGTWVVYLLKNREIIGKDIADDMIRKVVILSAVNVALCNSLPIDDWTHLGAILIGTFFGILAGPTMQLNVTVKDPSSDKKDEEAAAYLWFNDGASPVRLTLVFALCLGIFFILYQLSISGSNDFYLLDDLDDFA